MRISGRELPSGSRRMRLTGRSDANVVMSSSMRDDPLLTEEVMRGSRMYWDMYTRDSISAIKDEIESAYLDDEADGGTIARRVEPRRRSQPEASQSLAPYAYNASIRPAKCGQTRTTVERLRREVV